MKSLFTAIKGHVGEFLGAFSQFIFLDNSIYHVFNNVLLPRVNGDTTQIDHIIVSKYGIFVTEAKNMKGWIFGDEKQATWTQTLFKEKYTFQNPLRQNYLHIKTLSELLALEENKFHSVVMFWGTAELKTAMPDNVLTHSYTSYIKSKKVVLLSDSEVKTICDKLSTGKLKNSFANTQKHVDALKKRFESTDICPQCGAKLTLRTAKTGSHRGQQFLGCSRYPTCRYIKNL
ncbi:NERD domain-containing protein [Beggiatoa leptomitoformis]|uniref:NERD domain-containing protein n=1 Tax=Beggiatoa leptomitoformis TaxID=288004 RepID=A0A2N9YIE9_9GAMM|nr:NERD domain-containing protein [Beggiatoa leptomitoformis]AUI70179.2 NERD domain-containing protein [Beggiatoa leptomitoformis]